MHTLHEGVRGDFGSISIVLALLWALFTAMLLISWLVIRRMVSNMYTLQHSLQWQAWHDPLTRLNNRGALFERANVLAKQCQQQSLPLSVIQIDLDHFKGINDRFGHQAGDKVLSHAGGLIASALRANDVGGRVGGEEFCVVLPGLTLEEAANVAERIRARIDSKEILVKKSVTLHSVPHWASAARRRRVTIILSSCSPLPMRGCMKQSRGTQLRCLARSQQEVIEPFAPARGAGTLRVINPFRAIVLQRNALAVNAFDHHRKVDAV